MERPVDISEYARRPQTLGALALKREPTPTTFVTDGKVVSFEKPSNVPPQKRVDTAEKNYLGFDVHPIQAEGKKIMNDGDDDPIKKILLKPGSFLQFFTRGESDQVATISGASKGGRESAEEVIAAVSRGLNIAGVRRYHDANGKLDRITFLIEDAIDPDEAIEKYVEGSRSYYEGIKAQDQLELLDRRRSNLIDQSSRGKARLFRKIFTGEQDALVQALGASIEAGKETEGQDSGDYTFGYKVINGELVSLDMGDENGQNAKPQSMIDLTRDDRVAKSMVDGVTDLNDWLAGGIRRSAVTMTLDISMEQCCPAATGVMEKILDAFKSGYNQLKNAGSSLISTISQSAENLKSQFIGPSPALIGGAATETGVCRTCSETKNSEGKCNCSDKK